jgi:hypothetical protein
MTTTKTISVQATLNAGNANEVSDCLRLMKAGYQLSPIKATFSGLTSSAVQFIGSAVTKAAAVAGSGTKGITLDTNENYPAIGLIKSVRVTTGAAAAGPRQVVDAGGTASASVALLADDGTTLTFETTVTGYVIEYYPAPAVDMTSDFAPISGS